MTTKPKTFRYAYTFSPHGLDDATINAVLGKFGLVPKVGAWYRVWCKAINGEVHLSLKHALSARQLRRSEASRL